MTMAATVIASPIMSIMVPIAPTIMAAVIVLVRLVVVHMMHLPHRPRLVVMHHPLRLTVVDMMHAAGLAILRRIRVIATVVITIAVMATIITIVHRDVGTGRGTNHGSDDRPVLTAKAIADHRTHDTAQHATQRGIAAIIRICRRAQGRQQTTRQKQN